MLLSSLAPASEGFLARWRRLRAYRGTDIDRSPRLAEAGARDRRHANPQDRERNDDTETKNPGDKTLHVSPEDADA